MGAIDLKKIMQDELKKIIDFEKRSHAIKKISIERWGDSAPCPIRFVVNPYQSCSFKCPYCYVWFNKEMASVKPDFRKALRHDIERAKNLGLNSYLVEVSASTDPFQFIEKEEGETLFAVTKLLDNGFRVLLVTKNPGMLLDKAYQGILNSKNVFLDVTLTSLKEGSNEGYFLNNNGPSAIEKLEAIREIIKRGGSVRVKIEPVVPTYGNIVGQTAKDLEELLAVLNDAGVKTVIAKTLRLNADMPQSVIESLLPFYKENGELVANNYFLSSKIRRKMLDPIYEKCDELGIRFSPCYDYDAFNQGDKISFCDIISETTKRISDLYNNARVAE